MQVMHKQMEAAKQVFGDDLNIAQLNLKCLEAWGEQINSQRTSGEPRSKAALPVQRSSSLSRLLQVVLGPLLCTCR